MEGYYTKKQAANVLGVTVRQISNYMSEKHLRVVYQGKKAWIPKGDVQRLYSRVTWSKSQGDDDILDLQHRLAALTRDVEVLKLSLGFGAHTKPRDVSELLLLRQKFMDLLAEDSWTNKQLSSIADDLISVHEEELLTLYTRVGSIAWIPLDHLSSKMITFIERHEAFPTKGLDVLRARLMKARDRFLGLVYVNSKIPAKRSVESATLMGLLDPLGSIDKAVMGYILR